MQSRSYTTRSVSALDIKREWFVIDADGKTLGRMATQIATILRGKHKATFTPNSDCGDNVIVLNSAKVRMTGNKLNAKQLIHYTGFPGGQRFRTPRQILEKNPNELIEIAVKGMLPKSTLGAQMFRRLYVYSDANHAHAAQQPKAL